MSTNHARDNWADARTDEVLHRELDALAGLGADASGLDAVLGSVRSRVRRRRVAKQTGIGVSALALVAALAVGGAGLLPDQPRPLPGPAGTPTPPQTDGPTMKGTALGLVEDGYQPGWLEGTGLTCGMAVDDIPARTDDRLDLRTAPTLEDDTSADGTETARYWRAPTRLAVPDPGDAGRRASRPSLVWVQDGRVVDVGIDVTEAGMDQVRDAPAEREAEDSSLMSCAPEHPAQGGGTSDTYATELPAGDYEVRAFVQLWSPDFTDVELVLSDPVSVTVGEPVGAASAEDGAECSAAGMTPGTPDWSALPAAVRTTAQQIVDAALACDDERLIELAQSYPRATDLNWGNRSAREAFELPGAEQDEDVYAILVGLLTGTRPCAAQPGLGDASPAPVGWPVVSDDVPCPASSADWQDAVDASAITATESVQMQDVGSEGYAGWRLAITATGDWQQLVDGSWEDLQAGA